VLRFWEGKFTQLRPLKRGGGRRYYRPEDVQLLRGIRQLLYQERYTIKGVQRILREQGVQFVMKCWQETADGVGNAANHEIPDIAAEVAKSAGSLPELTDEARQDLKADQVTALRALHAELVECKRLLAVARN